MIRKKTPLVWITQQLCKTANFRRAKKKVGLYRLLHIPSFYSSVLSHPHQTFYHTNFHQNHKTAKCMPSQYFLACKMLHVQTPYATPYTKAVAVLIFASPTEQCRVLPCKANALNHADNAYVGCYQNFHLMFNTFKEYSLTQRMHTWYSGTPLVSLGNIVHLEKVSSKSVP